MYKYTKNISQSHKMTAALGNVIKSVRYVCIYRYIWTRVLCDTKGRPCNHTPFSKGDHLTAFLQGRAYDHIPSISKERPHLRPHPSRLSLFLRTKLFPIIIKSVKMIKFIFCTKINFDGLFFCQDKASWCDEGSANVHQRMRNLGQPSSPSKNDDSSVVMN